MKGNYKKIAVVLMCILICSAADSSPYEQWSNGPSKDPGYFPIGVWLQSPASAWTYKKAGVNVYVGLWGGPSQSDLNTLKSAGMQTICAQNTTALDNRTVTLADGRPLIVAYMHEDEPDNAQPLPTGGYGAPIPTSTIQELYQQMKSKDSTRPIWLNLSQGIGNDNAVWIGQGGYIVPDRDYPAYIAGCDIVSFDIYPMNCGSSATCGDAWRVALGIDRLRNYAGPEHPVWNFIETADISANGKKVTIDQLIAEVWMSIIHGSKGIVYFIHGKTVDANFDYQALLKPENADRLAAVTKLNNQIKELAPVINQPNTPNRVQVEHLLSNSKVDYVVKVYNDVTYIFTVGMTNEPTFKRITLKSYADCTVEVLGENRQIIMTNSDFEDAYDGYRAHIYKVTSVPLPGDLDLDMDVDMNDVNLFWKAWQSTPADSNWNWLADLYDDGSNRIDQNDFKVLLSNWLAKPSAK